MSKDAKAAPIVFSCSGQGLTEKESRFFQKIQPAGFILFKRNCNNPTQVKNLIQELNATCAHAPLMMVDQEGGRVARLTPPHWQTHPPAADYGKLYEKAPSEAKQAAYEGAKKIALELHALGFNINCFPVLDVPIAQGDKVIGDRATHRDPAIVAALGQAQVDGLKAGGILPVLKHIPGHGRATQDSHHGLPRVQAPYKTLAQSDFVPFRHLNQELIAMTAHILYEALDSRAPATLSKRIIKEIVRDDLGFKGLLLSDDINMEALSGALPDRACLALSSGCDIVLHCSGKLDEMALLAEGLPPMAQGCHSRFNLVLGAIDEAKTPLSTGARSPTN